MPDTLHSEIPGFTPETLAVRAEFRTPVEPVATFDLAGRRVEVRPGRDTVWIVVRREGRGAVALRTVPWSGPYESRVITQDAASISLAITTASGDWRVDVDTSGGALRVTTTVTPREDLLLAFWPRDLYVLDQTDNPCGTQGWVEAAQRGVNTGLCYACMDTPAFGSFLYMQNLSRLNPFFAATQTRPDGVVGGEWPELGYQPPTSPDSNSPPVHPLSKGDDVVISDALMTFRDACGRDEVESAEHFIAMLAQLYPCLDKPDPKDHDWAGRARRTIDDLETAVDAVQSHYGYTYLRPYLGAETPDSMVQLTVLAALRRWQRETGEGRAVADRLEAGIHRFYDHDLKTFRRYLDDAAGDKDIHSVDSWYLYHPLKNLARLASWGDAGASSLLFASLDAAIKAAQTFDYVWPILFDMRDLSVIQLGRDPEGPGQTDVGGLYAYVMMQAFELTGEARYVDEAGAAMAAMAGMRFNTTYQTNLTAWGAVAALKLWRRTGDDAFRRRSHVFIANLLHNVELWDSKIKHAAAYTNFFGLTCLHNGPYMAAFEAYETFCAMGEYLAIGGDDLDADVRRMIEAYRTYARDVCWYFYPDTLPEEAIAAEVKNGRIERGLSFPLEDLYGDGQPAGQIGQEIYGCGAAIAFALEK